MANYYVSKNVMLLSLNSVGWMGGTVAVFRPSLHDQRRASWTVLALWLAWPSTTARISLWYSIVVTAAG